MTNAVTTPKTITEPARANIFEPVPRTRPSLLNSMAMEVIEFANPVTGTARPAPAILAILSKTPNPVKTAAINITVATVGFPAFSFDIPRPI